MVLSVMVINTDTTHTARCFTEAPPRPSVCEYFCLIIFLTREIVDAVWNADPACLFADLACLFPVACPWNTTHLIPCFTWKSRFYYSNPGRATVTIFFPPTASSSSRLQVYLIQNISISHGSFMSCRDYLHEVFLIPTLYSFEKCLFSGTTHRNGVQEPI